MPHSEPDINKFRKRLNYYRNDTLDRTAKKLGVGKRTYQDWINPHKEKWPSVDNLIKLANTYEVTTDYILGISDFRTPEKDFVGNEIGLTDEAIDKLRKMKEKDQTTALQIISDLLTAPDFDKILAQFLDLYIHANHQKQLNSLGSALTHDEAKAIIKSLTPADYTEKSEKLRLIDWYIESVKNEIDSIGNAPQFLKSTYADISRLSWNLAESYYQSKTRD